MKYFLLSIILPCSRIIILAQDLLFNEKTTLIEKATSKVHVYNTIPGKIMSGDSLPFNNQLVLDGVEVGSISGVCTYLVHNSIDKRWECSYTLSVENVGDISVVGIATKESRCSDFIITGGTGKYTSIKGVDTLCWPNDVENEYTHAITKFSDATSPVLNLPLVERPNVQSIVYNTYSKEMNLGDVNYFYNNLYGKVSNSVLGTLNGLCTYVNVDDNTMQCCTIYDFPNEGRVASFGILSANNQTSTCNTQSILGGTGRYIGAKGTIDICVEKDEESNNGFYSHQIKMMEPSQPKPIGSYKLTEKPDLNNNIHIFNTNPGVVSIGDIVPFQNKLYNFDDNKRIGTLNGICNYVNTTTSTSWYCEMIYQTNNGQIMASGILDDVNECSELAIIGGTNTFINVDGYVTICFPESFHNNDTLVDYDKDVYLHTLYFDAGTAGATPDSSSSKFNHVSALLMMAATMMYLLLF